MSLSLLMRFHMVNPNVVVKWFAVLWPAAAAGGIMTPELYLSLMTMHGTIMVFFVLTTVPQSGFGNYFLPIQIGAEDMAFPVLNMMSFWTTFLALVVMVAAFFVKAARRSRVGPPIRRSAARARSPVPAKAWARTCGSSASRFSAAPR
jgi:cytochrome c oxidase subunit 1